MFAGVSRTLATPITLTTRDALEGKGPQRRPQKRLDMRLEEVAKAVGGRYCRLQMPLRPFVPFLDLLLESRFPESQSHQKAAEGRVSAKTRETHNILAPLLVLTTFIIFQHSARLWKT